MKKGLNIALLAESFIDWGGGIDFLCNCTNALTLKEQSHALTLYLLFPEKDELSESVRRYKLMLKDILNLRKPQVVKPASIDKESIFRPFRNINPNIKIVYYKKNNKGLVSILKEIEADVVMPVTYSLGLSFPIPWIGYVYDLQHRYLKGNFTTQESLARDKTFGAIMNDSNAIIVNSKSVKEDLINFSPEATCKIFNLPFAPTPIASWFAPEHTEIMNKYNLPEQYFVISNQFWVHKSHLTAFEALSKLKGANAYKVHIVCTGKTEDYRFPEYFSELTKRIDELGLSKRIHFTGYISKIDQIQIMRNAIGVLQPTLFEGGPGGGAVYDAVAMGVPAIVSDIPVNLEIDAENVVFFKAGSPENMSIKMLELMNKNIIRAEENTLIANGKSRSEKLGTRLLEAINFVISKNNNYN